MNLDRSMNVVTEIRSIIDHLFRLLTLAEAACNRNSLSHLSCFKQAIPLLLQKIGSRLNWGSNLSITVSMLKYCSYVPGQEVAHKQYVLSPTGRQ